MYLEDDDIEKLYSDFKNESVTPPNTVKENVMLQINQGSKRRYVLTLVFLLAISGIFFLLFNSKKQYSHNTENQDVVSENIEVSQPEVFPFDKRELKKDSKNLNSKLEGNQILNSKESISEEITNTVAENQFKYAQKSDKVEENQNNFAPLTETKYFSGSKSKKEEHLDTKNKSKGDSNFAKSSEQKSVEELSSEASIKTVFLDKEENMEEKERVDELKKLLPIHSILDNNSTIKKANLEIRNLKKEKKVHFGIEMNTGYLYSNVLTKPSAIEFDQIGAFQNIHNFQFGMNGLLYYKSLIFKIGFGYEWGKSITNYQEKNKIVRTTIVYQEAMDTSQQDTYLFSFTDSIEGLNQNQLAINTHYFNLPLHLGYQFRLKSRLHLQVLAGVQFSFLSKVNYSFRGDNLAENIPFIGTNQFRKVLVHGLLDLGLQYRLTEKIDLGISLPFRVGFNSKLIDSKVLNYGIGAKLKLAYYF